jgi:hypothetical protein
MTNVLSVLTFKTILPTEYIYGFLVNLGINNDYFLQKYYGIIFRVFLQAGTEFLTFP